MAEAAGEAAGELPAAEPEDAGAGRPEPRPWSEGSAGREDEEQQMQCFFQQHLMSILEPLAEQVQELQEQARRLSEGLGCTDERLRGQSAQLHSQAERLGSLETEAGRTKVGLDEAHTALKRAGQEHESLRVDHETVKANLARSNEDLRDTAARAGALEQAMEASNSNAQHLGQSLNEVQDLASRTATELAELRHFAKQLDERQVGHELRTQEVRRLSESSELALAKLTAAFGKHKKEAEQSHAQSDERYRSLNAMLEDTHNVVRVQAGQLKKAEADMRRLSDCLGVVQRSLDSLNGESQDQPVESLMDRLGIMEDRVGATLRALAAQQELAARVEGLAKAVDAHSGELGRHTTSLQGLGQGQQGHDERLHTLEGRVGSIGCRQEQLMGELTRTKADLGDLAAAHREAANKIEVHASQLEDAHGRLQRAENGLGAAKSGIEKLGTDLRATKEDVAKTDASLEVAHRYLQGVGKGVQETHRRVAAGQDGMLAPRSSPGKTLPTLPSARPRTAAAAADAAALVM